MSETEEGIIIFNLYLFQVTGHSSVGSFIVGDKEEPKERSRSRVFRYCDYSGTTERKKFLSFNAKNKVCLLTF